MNIHKYIIKEEQKFFSYIYHILDEFEKPFLSFEMNGWTGKIKPININGVIYELKRKSHFTFRTEVFKDGIYLCSIGPKNGFSSVWEIDYAHQTIRIKSNLSFNRITIYKDNAELGKVSRQTKRFKSIFGMALYDDVDPVVVAFCLTIRLMVLRASMAV